MLSGEYFVLDGAKALAIPTRLGQYLNIQTQVESEGLLKWVSLDEKGEKVLSATFSLDDFSIVKSAGKLPVDLLQELLKAARKERADFLREKENITATSRLEFPFEWGLGSSSTLIYNIASWSKTNPFKLLQTTIGGSGYDIACAGADSPIIYSVQNRQPEWKTISFLPSFAENLFFIYLGKKQNSREGIKRYQSLSKQNELTAKISRLTEKMLCAENAAAFQVVMEEHEDVVASALQLKKVKALFFHDFPGSVKSLGAWGGDFVMACSEQHPSDIKSYFQQKGFPTIFSFKEIFLPPAA